MIRIVPLVLALAHVLPAAAQTRAEIVRKVIPSSVRVQLLVDGQVKRSASGVVVATEPAIDGKPARSAVLTNAHVADPKGLGKKIHYKVLIEKRGRVVAEHTAQLAGLGDVPEMDLALLEVKAALDPASLGDEETLDLGDELVVVGAPYGKSLSVSGGMVSQIEAAEGPKTAPLRFTAMKTDASIGYGSSGGGVFHVPSGRLVGIVEGYRTARVSLGEKMAFDVPMPGETFIAPITKVRTFLARHLARNWTSMQTLTAALAEPDATTSRK